MIWWNIKELERRLKSGEVTDKQIFYYLLPLLLSSTIVPYIGVDENRSMWVVITEAALSFAMTVVGTKITYDINLKGDSADYFRRYLALSFVVFVRFFVFLCVVGIFIAILLGAIYGSYPLTGYPTIILEFSIMIIGGSFYYFMLARSFKRVSQ